MFTSEPVAESMKDYTKCKDQKVENGMWAKPPWRNELSQIRT